MELRALLDREIMELRALLDRDDILNMIRGLPVIPIHRLSTYSHKDIWKWNMSMFEDMDIMELHLTYKLLKKECNEQTTD